MLITQNNPYYLLTRLFTRAMILIFAMKPQAKNLHKQDAGPVESCLEVLRGFQLFSGLADSDLHQFKNAVHQISLKKNKIIYLQGDESKFFYIIIKGWVKLLRTMPEGEEVIIDMLTSKHMFAESAIFENDHHMCSAQVVEDVQMLSIPAKLLREQIGMNPVLALNMLSSMSKHHRHHYGALAFNAMLSAPKRIGCFLLKLCRETQTGRAAFDLPYDKTLIADTLGMKGATFSRALNILRHKTGIRLRDARVEIDSVQKLAEYVYGANSGIYKADHE